MTFIDKLTQCKSIEALSDFCSHLDRKDVQFNGRQYLNRTTGDSLELDALAEKMINLFKSAASTQSDTVELDEKTSALIFSLKLITREHSEAKSIFKTAFSNESSIVKLENECKTRLRKNDEMMKTILNNYNNLAIQFNQKKIGRQHLAGRVSEDFSRMKSDLRRLEFLNTFLAVKWEKDQREGSSPSPYAAQAKSMQHLLRKL